MALRLVRTEGACQRLLNSRQLRVFLVERTAAHVDLGVLVGLLGSSSEIMAQKLHRRIVEVGKEAVGVLGRSPKESYVLSGAIGVVMRRFAVYASISMGFSAVLVPGWQSAFVGFWGSSMGGGGSAVSRDRKRGISSPRAFRLVGAAFGGVWYVIRAGKLWGR